MSKVGTSGKVDYDYINKLLAVDPESLTDEEKEYLNSQLAILYANGKQDAKGHELIAEIEKII